MLLTDTKDAVTTLTLSHPPVNAISEEWVRAFDAKLDQLANGPRYTVLHIRSDQKVFCAGADLKEVRARGRPLLDQCQLRLSGADRYADARHPLGEAA